MNYPPIYVVVSSTAGVPTVVQPCSSQEEAERTVSWLGAFFSPEERKIVVYRPSEDE